MNRKKRRGGCLRRLGLLLLILLALALTVAALSPLPPTGAATMSWLKDRPIAHRGLHTSTVSENSLAAFDDAIAAGYCIELDLRLSADGEIMVIHDDSLQRVCGQAGRVSRLTREELRACKLTNGEDIPTLAEVLSRVDGREPILIELKPARTSRQAAELMLPQLDDYAGEFAIQSFDPWLCRYVKQLRPDWQVGLLDNGLGFGPAWLRLALDKALIRVCRPDFISYRLRAILPGMLDDFRARGTAVLAYGVFETQLADPASYLEQTDNLIFDREPLIKLGQK